MAREIMGTDDLERRFIEKGQTIKKLATMESARKAFGDARGIRKALMDAGLEVEGRVKKGLTPSGRARFSGEVEELRPEGWIFPRGKR